MPGGESTTISLLASHTPGLLEGLKAFVQDPERAVWGTCAGMILMSDEDRGIGGGKIRKVDGGSLGGWGGIKGLRVWRNLYGSMSTLTEPVRRSAQAHSCPAQLESFEAPMEIPVLSNPTKPFNTIFIRAPAIHSLSPPSSPSDPEVQVLATLPEEYQPPPPPADSPLGAPVPEDLGKVMVRKGKKLVTSFHPELSGDNRIHEYWIESCLLGRR